MIIYYLVLMITRPIQAIHWIQQSEALTNSEIEVGTASLKKVGCNEGSLD